MCEITKILLEGLKLNSPPTGNIKEYGTRTHYDSPLRREGTTLGPGKRAGQKGQGDGEALGDCSPALSPQPEPARTLMMVLLIRPQPSLPAPWLAFFS